MNTKIRPATALPWEIVAIQKRNIVSAGVPGGDDFRVIADMYYHTKVEVQRQNAAYIAHAANAYTALVEALVKIVKYADSEPDGGDFVEMHRANIERARDVLQKLGEEA